MNWLTSRIIEAESQIKNLVTVAASKLDAFVPEDGPADDSSLQEEDLSDYGITPTVLEFVENVCNHPNTFRDFPIQNYGNSPKKLSPKQEKHAVLMLERAPELSKLRYKLCPGVMKEEMFWRVYFLVLQNKIGYIFSDEVFEQEVSVSSGGGGSGGESQQHDTLTANIDNNNDNNNNTEQQQQETTNNNPIDSNYLTPDNKRKHKSTTTTSSTNTSSVTPTPQEIEEYFEKTWTPTTTPVDEGIEPDYDNYFSPQRLTYEIDT